MDVDGRTLDDGPTGLFPSPIIVERHAATPAADASLFDQRLANFMAGAPGSCADNLTDFSDQDFDDLDLNFYATDSLTSVPRTFDYPAVPANVPVAAPQVEPVLLPPVVPVVVPPPVPPVIAAPVAPPVQPVVAPAAPVIASPQVAPVIAPPAAHVDVAPVKAPPRRRCAGCMSVASQPPRRTPAASLEEVSEDTARNVLADVTTKRLAAANAPTPPSIDTVNARTLPAWLESHFIILRTSFRGEVEDAIIVDWLTLECEDEHHGGTHKLRAAGRPKELSAWTRKPFPISSPPNALDVHTFGEVLRAWWSSIMPKWRQPVGRDWPLLREVPEGEKWSEVRKVGTGGIFVVLVGLLWWRLRCGGSLAEKHAYESLLEDVAWALRDIVKDMPTFASRERPECALEHESAPSLRKSGRESRPSKRALGI